MKVFRNIMLGIFCAVSCLLLVSGCKKEDTVTLSGISLAEEQTLLAYQYRDFDTSKIKVIEKYSNNTTKEIKNEDLTFSKLNTDNSGEQTLTITYKGFTISQKVNVIKLNRISCPIEVSILHNSDFSKVPFDANAYYTYQGNSKSFKVRRKDLTLSEIDTSITGQQELNITYKTFTAKSQVNVLPKVIGFKSNAFEGEVSSILPLNLEININSKEANTLLTNYFNLALITSDESNYLYDKITYPTLDLKSLGVGTHIVKASVTPELQPKIECELKIFVYEINSFTATQIEEITSSSSLPNNITSVFDFNFNITYKDSTSGETKTKDLKNDKYLVQHISTNDSFEEAFNNETFELIPGTYDATFILTLGSETFTAKTKLTIIKAAPKIIGIKCTDNQAVTREVNQDLNLSFCFIYEGNIVGEPVPSENITIKGIEEVDTSHAGGPYSLTAEYTTEVPGYDTPQMFTYDFTLTIVEKNIPEVQ